MIYQCDICSRSDSVSLVTLDSGCEKYLARKLLKNKKKIVLHTSLGICSLCFKKLQLFKDTVIYKLIVKIPEKQVNILNMHYPNYPPPKNEDSFDNQCLQIPSLNLPPTKSEEENRNQYIDLKTPTNIQTNDYMLPPHTQTRESFVFPPPTTVGDYLFSPPKTTIASNEYIMSSQKMTNIQVDPYNTFSFPSQSSEEVHRLDTTCTDDYNCQCDSCQNKYGDLPILLQGIEQKTFNEKTDPQPSTSSQYTPKRILTCEYCKKTFTHKGDFNKHLRKHTKEKPFSCHICNRKFGHTSNLLRHQRLHSGEKPFACDNCDKRFSRKDKLDCHKRSRTCYDSSARYQ